MTFISPDLTLKIFFFIFLLLSSSFLSYASDLKAAKKSIQSGFNTVRLATRIETENLINANTTADSPDKDPYRAKIVMVSNVAKSNALTHKTRIKEDQTPFILEHNPGHPAANQDGIVKKSNVRREIVMANINQINIQAMALKNVYDVIKSMDNHSMEILKS